jgi:hypothetical protein
MTPELETEQQHQNMVTALARAKVSTTSALAQVLSNNLDSYIKIITQQSYELALFRSLEIHMRNNSLTTEGLADILSKLEKFRTGLIQESQKSQTVKE